MHSPTKAALTFLVSLVLLTTGTNANANTITISPVGSSATQNIYTSDVASDRNNVVWLSSNWNPDLKTAPLERYRVAVDGSVTRLTDAQVKKVNPSRISNGEDGRIYLVDTLNVKIAAVTLNSDSSVKKVRIIRKGLNNNIYDVAADSVGRVYVLCRDRILVLKKNAKSFRKPIRTILFSFGNDDKNITIAPDGTIFVNDSSAESVYAFTPDQSGAVSPARTINIANDVVPAGFGPLDVAIGPDGELIVVYWLKGIAHFNPTSNGASVTPLEFNPLDGAFSNPQGITIDDNRHMIVGDYTAGQIKVFNIAVG